jgi:hypothetical protein
VSLELLTTLRRIQRRAAPVHIRLGIDVTRPLVYEFPALPQVPVALVNRDAEKLAVGFTEGSDYRTGRPARWRFEVRNAAGKLMPVREWLGYDGGGLYNEGALGCDETWSTDLDTRAFVPALPPGRYTVRILYHDCLCISEMADARVVAALVTCASGDFSLVVVPRVVTVSNASNREIRRLLDRIELDRPVRIVAGTYGRWAEELVPPDSAQGRLLKFEFQAVPPLLRALEDERLPAERRAVILGLLFSLTAENDRREEHSVVGECRFVEGPWSAWGGDGAGGISFGGSGSSTGTIDEAKQREFAKRWSSWKDHVRVARPPGDAD